MSFVRKWQSQKIWTVNGFHLGKKKLLHTNIEMLVLKLLSGDNQQTDNTPWSLITRLIIKEQEQTQMMLIENSAGFFFFLNTWWKWMGEARSRTLSIHNKQNEFIKKK